MTSFTRYRRRASMGAIVLFVTGFAMLIIGIVLTGIFASKEKKTETIQQPIADADLRSFDIVLNKKWTDDYNNANSTVRKTLEADIKKALENGLKETRAASGKINVQKVSISQVQKTADDKVRAYASAIYVAYDDGTIPTTEDCGDALKNSNGLDNATISAKPDPIQFCNNYENNNATTTVGPLTVASTTPGKTTPSKTTTVGGSTKPATTMTSKVTTTTLPAVTTPASTPASTPTKPATTTTVSVTTVTPVTSVTTPKPATSTTPSTNPATTPAVTTPKPTTTTVVTSVGTTPSSSPSPSSTTKAPSTPSPSTTTGPVLTTTPNVITTTTSPSTTTLGPSTLTSTTVSSAPSSSTPASSTSTTVVTTTIVPGGSTQTTQETTVITSSAPTTTTTPSTLTTTVPLTSTASPSTVPSSSASPTTPSGTSVSTSTVTTPSSSTISTTNVPTTASPTTPLSSTAIPSTVPSSSVPTTPSTQTSVEPTTPSEPPTTESTFEPSTTQESTTPTYTGTTLKPVTCYQNASNVQQNVIVIYDMSNSSVIPSTTLKTFISGIFAGYKYTLDSTNIFQSLPLPFPDTESYNPQPQFARSDSSYQNLVKVQFLFPSAVQGSKINDALNYVNTHPFIRLTQRPRTIVIVSHGYDDIDTANVTATELKETWNIVTVATGGANSTILNQLATNSSYTVEGGNLTDPAGTTEKVKEVLAGICSLDSIPTTTVTTTTPRPTTTTTTAAPTTTGPFTCVNQSVAFAFDMSGSYLNDSSTGMILFKAIQKYGVSNPQLSPAALGVFVPFPDTQDYVDLMGFDITKMRTLNSLSSLVTRYYYQRPANQQPASLFINDTLNLVLQRVNEFRYDKSVVLFLSNTDNSTVSNGVSVASTLRALHFDIFVVHVGNVTDACASIATDSDHCSLIPDLSDSTQVASVFDGIVSLMLQKSPTLSC